MSKSKIKSIMKAKRLRVTVFFILTLCAFLTSLQSDARAIIAQDQAVITAGKKLFNGACSNSYCHGSEGTGGSGPKLNRSFTADYLTRIITEGKKGTAMPGFGSAYSKAEIAALVAYVMTLSPGGANSLTTAHSGQPAATSTSPAETKAEPKATLSAEDAAALRGGNAEAGRALFFDAAVLDNCRACHTFNGRGGKVGPDLTNVRQQSVAEILKSITEPNATITANYEAIVITMRSGQRFTGVRRDEDGEMIRLFDTSSMPPVSRAFLKTEIASTEKLNQSAMPANYGAKFSKQQLLDLVTWLKTGE